MIRKDTPEDSPARLLIDWLLTGEGQTLAVKAGYIPLRPMENVWPNDAIDPIYLGDVDNSSGTGGTEYRGGEHFEELIVGGVRKPLSDVFYDGFNYIQYINSEITSQILAHEYTSKRPFPGIPNDYPHYGFLGEGWLTILFPYDNPFFDGSMTFQIHLTEDISPYGSGQQDRIPVTYNYDREMLPGIDLFTIRINLPDEPDITERINQRLQAWTDGFPGDEESKKLLEEFARWLGTEKYHYRFYPLYGQWKNYISVTYDLDCEFFNDMPVVYTICFDMNTGDEVNLVDTLPSDLPFSTASVVTQITSFPGRFDDDYPSQEYFENYTPPAGTVINEAWLWGDMLGLYLTEPNGRQLQAFFYDEWN